MKITRLSTYIEEKKVDKNIDERKPEDKLAVEEKISSKMEQPKKNVKLIFGEDIRWAQLPLSCCLLQLREVIHDRFPSSRAVLIKYRDEEGDLVTITSDEELRLVEMSAESHGSLKLCFVGVSSEQDPFYEKFKHKDVHNLDVKQYAYLNLHGLAMKEYCEAMEDTVRSEEVQDHFDRAAEKF
ncbi:hypothetical protein DITRI_Ditri07aG0035200 [Diplodiscus trichospermus]